MLNAFQQHEWLHLNLDLFVFFFQEMNLSLYTRTNDNETIFLTVLEISFLSKRSYYKQNKFSHNAQTETDSRWDALIFNYRTVVN